MSKCIDCKHFWGHECVVGDIPIRIHSESREHDCSQFEERPEIPEEKLRDVILKVASNSKYNPFKDGF